MLVYFRKTLKPEQIEALLSALPSAISVYRDARGALYVKAEALSVHDTLVCPVPRDCDAAMAVAILNAYKLIGLQSPVAGVKSGLTVYWGSVRRAALALGCAHSTVAHALADRKRTADGWCLTRLS